MTPRRTPRLGLSWVAQIDVVSPSKRYPRKTYARATPTPSRVVGAASEEEGKPRIAGGTEGELRHLSVSLRTTVAGEMG